MMYSEFKKRTGFEPSAEEWEVIERSYMFSSLGQDAFCRAWVRANITRVREAREKEEERKRDNEKLYKMWSIRQMLNGVNIVELLERSAEEILTRKDAAIISSWGLNANDNALHVSLELGRLFKEQREKTNKN